MLLRLVPALGIGAFCEAGFSPAEANPARHRGCASNPIINDAPPISSITYPGRFAGLVYLLGSIPAFFALLYVPSKLFVGGNPMATAHNIAASETLFRWGIFANLVGQASFIVVALALYQLLKGVDGRLGILMVILITVPVPIGFASELNSVAALLLEN
ncbi:MAG TPA: DUF4386 domain-containing protein [Acidobacteriaceae bacterium]|jgi:hypothetical protein